MNVSDHEGVEALLSEIGVSLSGRRFDPRFNVAPTSTVLTVAWQDAPVPVDMHWGLIPTWARPGKFSGPLINARSETIWEKPSFRDAMSSSRVLIPVNGFYEWHRDGKTRRAFHIKPASGSGFLFGGISSISKEGEPQCCIVTTQANSAMAEVHHRMPVIIDPAQSEWWLRSDDVDELDEMMRPAANETIDIVPVSSYVNNARNEGPRCVSPDDDDE